jgi:hypothetical protein
MKMFARITKVDEERREVTGRAAQETVDRDGEVFDFASSMPNFQRWSAECYADSGGKSRGNIRAMHGPVAAGILTDIQFDPVEKSIDVTAKIVDDQEWRKVISGAYCGFSIGGRYSKKWAAIEGGKMVTRYTADPSEISIVDRPACPSAIFYDIHKRDGRVIRKHFKNTGADAMNFDRLNEALKKNVGSLAAIYSIHAKGSTPEDPIGREQVLKMRKRRNPGKEQIDLAELARSIRQMRKASGVALPPQSANAAWDSVRADDGATLVRGKSRIDDYMDDDMDDDEGMYNAQGVTSAYGNNAMVAAQVSAIKRALKRAPKRMGGR